MIRNLHVVQSGSTVVKNERVVVKNAEEARVERWRAFAGAFRHADGRARTRTYDVRDGVCLGYMECSIPDGLRAEMQKWRDNGGDNGNGVRKGDG